MSKLYYLKIIQTLDKNKNRFFFQGYLFNLLHLFLVANNKINISFNVKENEMIFFSESKDDLVSFLGLISGQKKLISEEIFENLKSLSTTQQNNLKKDFEKIKGFLTKIKISDIESLSFDIEKDPICFISRTRSEADKISNSKIKRDIKFLFNKNPEKIGILKIKIKKILDAFNITSYAEFEKKEVFILNEIKNRLFLDKDNLFIKNVRFSNQEKDCMIFLKKKQFLKGSFNQQVNRYGLSVKDKCFIFPDI
jgi:hypothetical protein